MSTRKKRNPNHLITEKSPYLLQHAYNPVNWYPWCEEAFQKAHREDVPIFLSIGYSTCHWCHVMAEESFEDHDIAQILNDGFVCIKVDREERPDIDKTYMAVCQMMTGRGGWPLTIVMTPDKVPFFAATYIPKTSRMGMTGLTEFLPHLLTIWKERREDIRAVGEEILFSLSHHQESTHSTLDESVLDKVYNLLLTQFDEKYGGFGSAPKFPMPHYLRVLLRYYIRAHEPTALNMVEKTLDAMRRGGIWDHVGFGFHRYSTDRFWHIPHFEKMLYDQALLAFTYCEAYQVTQNQYYKETAQDILTYVLRDMTSPEGAFYTAEDADSEGEEGKFYTWEKSELQDVADAPHEIQTIFSLFPEHTMGKERSHRIILHIKKPFPELAHELKMTEEELHHLLGKERKRLFTHREHRIHPVKDDKILADWNGLMIAACAKAAQVFDDGQYSTAARAAVNFIMREMKDGVLYHRFREGEKAIPGFLDDYAFLGWGLLELYEATFDPWLLTEACSLTDYLFNHFWDSEGGFFFTSHGEHEHEEVVRQKEAFDGALPSGNSVAFLNLLQLSRITGTSRYEEKAAHLLDHFSASVSQMPASHAHLLLGLDFMLGPTFEVVIVGDPHDRATQEMIRAVQHPFIPGKVLLVMEEGDESISACAPYTAHLSCIEGKPTCYVCQNHTCQLPTTDIQVALQQLGVYQ